jgi:hypothetical protein
VILLLHCSPAAIFQLLVVNYFSKKENNILFDMLVETNLIEFLSHRNAHEVILSFLLPQDNI